MADKKITYDGTTYDFSGISSDNSNKFGWEDFDSIVNPVGYARGFQRLFNKGEGLQYVNKNTLSNLVSKTVDTGRTLTLDEFKKVEGMKSAKYWQGTHLKDSKNWEDLYNQYLRFVDRNKEKFGFNSTNEEITPDVSPQEAAYNSYWRDLYSREDNTLGKEAYDNMLRAEQTAAQNQIDLANAQAQQTAMAQAQTVKNITDSLRAERMSRLRSGMSESQIAAQDMQTMLANTNALNDQIAASNLGILQGQQQMQGAQETAYQNWLNSMNQTGANASAMAAADAGDAYMQTLKRMQKTGESYNKANSYVTGNAYNNQK